MDTNYKKRRLSAQQKLTNEAIVDAAINFDDESHLEEIDFDAIKKVSRGAKLPGITPELPGNSTTKLMSVSLNHDVIAIGKHLNALSNLVNTAVRFFYNHSEFDQFVLENADPRMAKERRKAEIREEQRYYKKLRDMSLTEEEYAAVYARQIMKEEQEKRIADKKAKEKEYEALANIGAKILARDERRLAKKKARCEATEKRKNKNMIERRRRKLAWQRQQQENQKIQDEHYWAEQKKKNKEESES